ncbi:MAG: tetratricopeptide repeat protein, partial [Verrucomicrobia bacterium]|nr:tetratricopeptide repeat protein [Verrucomicrobiota bacterium]
MPAQDDEVRKLAAIMFTDMVGYSALSQRDPKLALELLEEHRVLLREIFPRFHGTEIKTIGDAFLVEFNSALEAAQCAIEIQRTLAHRNTDVPHDRHIEVKIGIHIGDVVHRAGDVYGDGVNIASRIEPLAGAGGICVSMDVERQIRNAVETRFEKLAPTELKNISVPMELFRIVLPWEKKSEFRGQKFRKSSAISPGSKRVWPAAALALLMIIGIGWWWSTLSRKTSPAQAKPLSDTAAPAKAIPQKSIAVLPFENLSDDKSNAYFAEGIQDEILTRLSKVGALKVISRTSTEKYKSAPDNLREVASQLGVANVLEGSVQKIGNAAHINVQLIRAATDEHVWAESYNRKLDDVFSVEGEVATAIAEQLNTKLTGAEQKVMADKPTNNMAAYDAYLRGLSTERSQYGYDSYRHAADAYAQAVQLDPKFALAWARLAVLRSFLYFNGIERNVNTPAAVKEAADRAMALAPEAGESWTAKGAYHYRVLRDFKRAVSAYQEAQKRLPNNSFVLQNLAFVLRRLGRWDEAEPIYTKALEIDPLDGALLGSLGGEYYMYLRRFDEALAFADRALAIAPDLDSAHATKAQILQQAGRLAEAAQELAQIPANSDDDFTVDSRVPQAMYERDFARAIRVIQQKLNSVPPGQQLDSLTQRFLVELGFCQEWTGQQAEAQQSFTRAVESIKPRADTVVAA